MNSQCQGIGIDQSEMIKNKCLKLAVRKIAEPGGLDAGDIAHVLLAGLHHIVIDHPLRGLARQHRGRVDNQLLNMTK